ncbi:MAG: Gfo/Idh/MocA family oxidoreductase [Solirubrobacteraceae bacterium]|nr:Gfo/Idh/MocA family oxidoreductase [Solirubrobacteraceae bacterium]
MPGAPVKIAVLGGGYGAKVPLPVLADIAEFHPVAVWSRTPQRAAELAEQHGLELGTSDVEELLAHPGLEAVHVATPVATHAEIAIAAARRGLHVLVDKPVALDLAEGRAVRDAVEAAGVVCAVNYGRRFQATRERLLARVAEVAGAPRMVSISLVFDDHALPESRPFTWVQDAALGGGRLQGYGVHDLDLLLAAFGEVDAVAAATEVGVDRRRDADGTPRAVTAEDAYVILVRFRGGGLGHISLTATARHGRGDVIEVHGSEGTVRLDADKRLHWGRAGEDLQVEGPLKADSKQAYARIARSFHAAIRDGSAPDPDLAEGLRVQALLDAVRRADAERRWVEPEPV